LVVNRTTSEQQGADIAERVRRTVRQFVQGKLAAAGSIPDDGAVLEASFRRQPFVIAAPQAPAAAGVRALAAWLVDHLETVRAGDPASFFARLLGVGADAKAA
jgi:flagellar biosynthesis protein FlhG